MVDPEQLVQGDNGPETQLERQLAGLGLFRQVLQREISAVDALDHLLGFGRTAFADQPARRFGGAYTDREQQRADHRGTGQHQAPGIVATVAQDRFTDHVGAGGTGEPQHGQGGQAWATVLLGQELHQQ
ncbi:hypothetical protein D3C85_1345280 [compost metagenome]